jgi:hypothetical protein
MTTETDLTPLTVRAMTEWAELLTRSARDALERVDTTLSLAAAEVAMVRERIARRHNDHTGRDTDA